MSWPFIAGGLIAAAIAFAGGVKVGSDHELAVQAREDKTAKIATDAAAKAAAEAIAGIKVKNTTIRQELEREIRTNTIYAECKHSPDGLRNINASLAKPGSASDSKLPGSDAAKR